jgi:hypothetical protein
LTLHFAVASAAAGLLVLHEEALPKRLDTQVALCVPKGESRGEARARKRAFAAFTTEKNCTLRTFRAQSADISSAAKHLRRFPNWIYRRAANCVAKIREQFCTSATQSIAPKVGIPPSPVPVLERDFPPPAIQEAVSPRRRIGRQFARCTYLL